MFSNIYEKIYKSSYPFYIELGLLFIICSHPVAVMQQIFWWAKAQLLPQALLGLDKGPNMSQLVKLWMTWILVSILTSEWC